MFKMKHKKIIVWGVKPDTGHTHTASADNAGGGGSHQNMQPSIRVNKLIRVL